MAVHIKSTVPVPFDKAWAEYLRHSRFTEVLKNPAIAALGRDLFDDAIMFFLDMSEKDERPYLDISVDEKTGALTATVEAVEARYTIASFPLDLQEHDAVDGIPSINDDPEAIEEYADALERLAATIRARVRA